MEFESGESRTYSISTRYNQKSRNVLICGVFFILFALLNKKATHFIE